ncbi:MAG: efflux RND transporter periplasmic adaptor subunit [Chthoniobacteraceae bacterium]
MPPVHESQDLARLNPTPPPPARQPRKGTSRWRWLTSLTLLAVVGIVAVRYFTNGEAPKGRPAGGERGAQPPVPVVAGTVEKKDVPIYLDGLGTVQALNTVTVRARVDGEIKKIAFVEGQDVKAGDLLVEIDEAPYRAAYDQAVAKKAEDEAQRANAQRDLDRYNDLAGKKVISSQQLDTQKALVRQFAATVNADEAAVESAKVQLDYTKVVAPISGRTGIRLVDQGNVVRAGDQTGLVVLAQFQPISLVFTLPEQSLTSIDKEAAAAGKLTVLGVDRDNKTVLDEGTLSVIDNQIDTTTGTIRLKATFPNEHLQLWPGQFVNARLLLSVRKDGLVVPASVVQRGPQGAFAFVIKADETVEIRPVKIGPIEKGQALIEEGLEFGERVVVDGQYKLQPGSKVKLSDGASKPSSPRGAGAGPRK